jgi:D-alanine--D-alanine ligase
MKVALLTGGRSLERQVSLRSGARVEDALAALGHDVAPLDADGELVTALKAARPDVAFIALHGPGGEDGTVQELLEILGVPYTGSGVAACVRSMDKVVAKHELRAAGISTPDWFAFNATAFRELGAADALPEISARLGFPLVVKEAYGSFGLQVYLIHTMEELLEKVKEMGNRLFLLQEYIASSKGKDIRLNVVGDQVVASVMRISETDFRANVGNGGRMIVVIPNSPSARSA